MRRAKLSLLFIFAFLLLYYPGCAPDDRAQNSDVARVSMQLLRHSNCDSDNSAFIGMDFLATDKNGAVIPCKQQDFDVSAWVSYTGPEGPFMPVPRSMIEFSCAQPGNAVVGVTVDLSGSEKGFLGLIKKSVRALVHNILAGKGMASIVRVSTHAYVVVPVTASLRKLDDAISGLFLHNGWTALYDGIRIANETLQEAAKKLQQNSPKNLHEFCTQGKKWGIVVYTDGRDNNSAEQHPCKTCKTPPDKVNTTIEDLKDLQVNGVHTPIYVVGVGKNIDVDALSKLASISGGRFYNISDYRELFTKMSQIGKYFTATHQVCIKIPSPPCVKTYFKIRYRFKHNNHFITKTKVYSFKSLCKFPH